MSDPDLTLREAGASPVDVTFRVGDFKVEGPNGLKQYLVANKEKFARGFSRQRQLFLLSATTIIPQWA
jgi:hypothetical protein